LLDSPLTQCLRVALVNGVHVTKYERHSLWNYSSAKYCSWSCLSVEPIQGFVNLSPRVFKLVGSKRPKRKYRKRRVISTA
jgi:hypothetical protein